VTGRGRDGVDTDDLEPPSRVLLGGEIYEQRVLVTGVLAPLSVGSTTPPSGVGTDPDTVVADGDSRKD
jgi:hypothetical protein